MTKQETTIILGILKTAYPRFYINLSEEAVKETILLWHEMLSDYTLQTVKIATKKLIAEMIYPPTIADVRASLVEITTKKPVLDASEAWGQIKKAIAKYGYYQEKKALERMNDEVREIVMRFGFKNLCMSENQMADRAHFIKLYDRYVVEEKRQKQIPWAIKKQQELIAQQGKNILKKIK
ncbi:MAG: replicative helicase loader/inhibitor [Alkaliphilus sp.]